MNLQMEICILRRFFASGEPSLLRMELHNLQMEKGQLEQNLLPPQTESKSLLDPVKHFCHGQTRLVLL